MLTWGVVCLTHDASIAVVDDDRIMFAAEAERYSKVKHDRYLNNEIVRDALQFGTPDRVFFYENVWLKKLRQFRYGNFKYALDLSRFPSVYLKNWGIRCPVESVSHHRSHAAAGYFTSSFREAAVLVLDALGEFETCSIWCATGDKLELKERILFPSSLGLLYSAFTKRCELKPCEEEYVLMGMAAWGEPTYANRIRDDFLDDRFLFRLKKRCHRGIGQYLLNAKIEDLAASVQVVLEDCLEKFLARTKEVVPSCNLVYVGGVALNCLANRLITKHFEKVWIMPNPGDAGSAIGSLAQKHLKWEGVYLGTDIPGDYPINRLYESLISGGVVGVAKGRAEYGPRALGNRSLLADPRFNDTKDRVNVIKRRQKFRPFAPAIPEELAKDFFDMPYFPSPYMQYVARCKYAESFPGIVHIDGTSRVQTVSKMDHPQFYDLLMEYYHRTGCPMLLNTSLNIRGRPMVNDWRDAQEFESLYQVPVF